MVALCGESFTPGDEAQGAESVEVSDVMCTTTYAVRCGLLDDSVSPVPMQPAVELASAAATGVAAQRGKRPAEPGAAGRTGYAVGTARGGGGVAPLPDDSYSAQSDQQRARIRVAHVRTRGLTLCRMRALLVNEEQDELESMSDTESVDDLIGTYPHTYVLPSAHSVQSAGRLYAPVETLLPSGMQQ